MKNNKNYWTIILTLVFFVGAIYFYFRDLEMQSMNDLPVGLSYFNINSARPDCGRWRENMPALRNPDVFQRYINARKLWRSKVEWELSHFETSQVLEGVEFSAGRGDWGAKALLAHFYLNGLGPLKSNSVLQIDKNKAVSIAREAVLAGIPWGFYDVGVAHERGYGGANYDQDLAWAYYLKGARVGSPEAQMVLAETYEKVGRREDAEAMAKCAFEQEHGEAAYWLAMRARVHERYAEAIEFAQEGVRFGNYDCASMLYILFSNGYWGGSSDDERKENFKKIGILVDVEREKWYEKLMDALKVNPDLRLRRLNDFMPLPPKEVRQWREIAELEDPVPNAPLSY